MKILMGWIIIQKAIQKTVTLKHMKRLGQLHPSGVHYMKIFVLQEKSCMNIIAKEMTLNLRNILAQMDATMGLVLNNF